MRHLTLLTMICAAMAAAEPQNPAAPAEPTAQSQEAETDTVFLNNGHRLSGFVEEENEATVTIRTDSGYMTLPRDLIAHIERSLEKEADTIDGDDYEATMKLVRRALLERRKKEARKLLEKAISMPGADSRAVRLLGAVLDDQGGHGERVRELYTRYRDEFKGTDQGTLERLAELNKMFADYDKALAELENKTKDIKIVEGFEARIGWRPENPSHFNPGTPKVIKDESQLPVEDKILRIDFKGGDKYKTSIRRRLKNDLTGSSSLRLDALNPGKMPLYISIAFKTGDGWSYHESTTQKLPGDNTWHEVIFDLQAATFKSEASNWNHSTTLKEAHDVRELHIQIHNGRTDGTVFIDAVNFTAM